MRRWRPHVIVVLASLLLGVATTYGVAWWLLNRPIGPNPTKPTVIGSPVLSCEWVGSIREKRGFTQVISASVVDGTPRRGKSFQIVSFRQVPADMDDVPIWSIAHGRSPTEVKAMMPASFSFETIFERAAGWPALAVVERMLVSHTRPMTTSPAPGHDLSYRGSQVANPFARTTLAFLPIWTGFASNVALYGSAWAGLILAAKAIRKRVRSRAGHCPKCRYDLGGLTSAVCPECGEEIDLASSRARVDTAVESVNSSALAGR